MFKIASVSGTPHQTPLGSLRRSPDPLYSCERLLAFGNRSFAPSALNPALALQAKTPDPLAPQTQNPRTATRLKYFQKLFQLQNTFLKCISGILATYT